MKHQIILFLLSIILTSCASMFNKKTIKAKVYTDRPAKIVVYSDTVTTVDNETEVKLIRNRKPVIITAIADTCQKEVTLKSHSSCAYYLNIVFNWGVGCLAERKNPKRFTYRKNISFRFDESIPVKRNSRWNLSVAANLVSFHIADAYTPEKLFAAVDMALAFDISKKTALRFTFTKSAHSDDTFMATGVYSTGNNIPEHTFSTAVEEQWWFNDYKLELILHPPKLAFKKSALYIPIGLGVRAVMRKNSYQPLLDDGSGINYIQSVPYIPSEMFNNNDVVPWGSKLLVLAGMGYNYQTGRLRLFAEPQLEFAIDGVGIQSGSTEHGRLRYHISAGAAMRIGK